MACFTFGIDSVRVLIQLLESKDPTFLRRLKSEYGRHDAIRHEYPLARPKNQKLRNDEDDEPIYLNEETQNSISKDEYKMLISQHQDSHAVDQGLPSSLQSPNSQAERPSTNKMESFNNPVLLKQQEASIGGNPKKRLAKVIGDDYKLREKFSKSEGAPSKIQRTSKCRRVKKVTLFFDEEVES